MERYYKYTGRLKEENKMKSSESSVRSRQMMMVRCDM